MRRMRDFAHRRDKSVGTARALSLV